MFKKILIANRGEIALRILQACRELGIPTVAIHSTADRDSLHVRHADETVCVGPPAAGNSYLDLRSILSATEITGADAVHPGYGFLAENARFAELLEECKVTWIGPTPATIRRMGDKASARQVAASAGVPVLPGSDGAIVDVADAQRVAAQVGYPVLLKASTGGGGLGMRIVGRPADLGAQLAAAAQQARRVFGDGTLYLEKYLEAPRHIEIQIFGDRFGRIIQMGERECSIQRRHQKLLEEAPSPGLGEDMRRRMGKAAVALAEAVDYQNAGTVEFLVDGNGLFYFLEMNTRIQVEHPVTEMVMGLDLVKLQILMAAGDRLDVPDDLRPRGHAMECRINAEHPYSFTPSPGRLRTFQPPGGPGVRVDTHGYKDYIFPPYYDSLVAKLIAFGRDRGEAIARMARALDFFEIDGIETTVPLHRRLIRDHDFVAGNLSTRFMERFLREQVQLT